MIPTISSARLLIAVRDRHAFSLIGEVILEFNMGDLLFFRPFMNDPNVAYKGMRQPYLFGRLTVRNNLRAKWESSWQALQGRARPVPPGWDVDHVFPVCWANATGFQYVLITPVPKTPNRSAGAGLEKNAARKENEELLAQYVDISVAGNCAYLTSAAISKLVGIAPGPASKNYPGLEKIKPDLQALQAVMGY